VRSVEVNPVALPTFGDIGVIFDPFVSEHQKLANTIEGEGSTFTLVLPRAS
jgi:hypothetical protein